MRAYSMAPERFSQAPSGPGKVELHGLSGTSPTPPPLAPRPLTPTPRHPQPPAHPPFFLFRNVENLTEDTTSFIIYANAIDSVSAVKICTNTWVKWKNIY